MDEEPKRGEVELGPDEVPDVEIHTGVRAKELRFGIVPETRVWFEGEPGERSSTEVERENLPEEVEPGVTYRDARVRWTARSRIVHPTDALDQGGDAPEEDADSD
jgi:hypothetical protein